jgi:guanylate kinase
MIDTPPRKGLIFALVGPSGVGKNTIMCRALQEMDHLRQLPTATTRERRATELEGREHFFHTEASFKALIEQDALLEWQWYNEHRYGILKETVDTAIAAQDDLVADIEVLGASILKDKYPNNAVLVFVAPPTMAVLEERIRERRTDTEEDIERRLARAIFEMKFPARSDYLVINGELDQAVSQFISIVDAERCRRDLENARVAAIFRKGQEVLQRCFEPNALPTATILPGELADQAVRRIAGIIGILDFEFQKQPRVPEDGIAPTQIRLETHHNRPVLVLTFECLVPDSHMAPAGWEWRPVSGEFPVT